MGRLAVKLWIALLFSVCAVSGATINVASIARSDLVAALNTANHGDVLEVPSGTAFYSSEVVVSKAVTIRFNAPTSITNNSGNQSYILKISTGQIHLPIRVTGGNFWGTGSQGQGIRVSSNQKNVRIDNCSFNNFKYHGILFSGFESYGVIDHCRFTNNYIHIEALGDNSASWNFANTPYGLGTTNTVCVEDCYLVHKQGALATLNQMIYVSHGGRMTFRHNEVLGTATDQATWFWDSHGNNSLPLDEPNALRGTVFAEIYSNYVNIVSGQRRFYLRGGTHILMSNIVEGGSSGTKLIVLTEEEGWYYQGHGSSQYGPSNNTVYPAGDQITNSFFVNNYNRGVLWDNNSTQYTNNFASLKYNTNDWIFLQLNRDYWITNNTPASDRYSQLIYPHPRVTLDDEEPGPGQARFSSATYSANENVTPLTVTVQRTGGSAGAVSVDYHTTNGTASAGTHFTGTSGTLSWADGNADNKTFNVTIANNGTADGNVNFGVVLSNASGGVVIAASSNSTVTIVDDDAGQFPLMGTLTFEAEDGFIAAPFTVADGAVSQSTETTDPANGGLAGYRVTIPSTGDYTVSFRLKAETSAQNSLFVEWDAEPISPSEIFDVSPLTGTEFQQRTANWRGSATGSDPPEFAPKVWSLSAGVHSLYVRGRERLVAIDSIIVAAANDSTPTAPSGLNADAVSESQIDLAWTDNANNEDGYILESSLSSGSGFTEVATLDAGTTSYVDSGLLSYTVYYYRVRAFNSSGESSNSSEASDRTFARDDQGLPHRVVRRTGQVLGGRRR